MTVQSFEDLPLDIYPPFFMEKACSVWHHGSSQNIWKSSSGTRSSRCLSASGGLLSKGKITKDLVNMMMGWRHSGFNLFCGPRIQPGQEEAIENLARYIIRASFSQERMTYIPEESKVLYQSKDGKKEKVFDALEWLAAMCSHVPNKGEQMVRYYGYCSNVSRGKRQKENQDGLIPYILEPGGSLKEYRKNWARLIQKIYEVDSLTCPKCLAKMKVISVIEGSEIIKRSLSILVCGISNPDPPPGRSNAPPSYVESYIDFSVSQLPSSDNWLYVGPEYPEVYRLRMWHDHPLHSSGRISFVGYEAKNKARIGVKHSNK